MKRTILALAAMATLALAGAAQAQGFAGFAAGQTRLSADCSGTVSCDNSGNGFKVYGGYKFSSAVGVELNYFDFGKAKASIIDMGTPMSAEIKTTALGVGVVVGGEFAPGWMAHARLGAAAVKTKVDGTAGGRSGSDKDSSTQAYYGADIGYAFGKSVALVGSIDFSKSKYAGESGNVRLVGIGLRAAF
jgi:hypothetical protein